MATLYYRPYTTEPIKDGEMPAYDAMESKLPEYQYIFNDPQQSSGNPDPPRARQPGPTASSSTVAPHARNARIVTDLDQTSMSVMDQQMREIDNYRQAVTRMGQDILALRATIRDLETANSKLRLQVSNFNDTTRVIVDSVQIDGLPKAEIAARYATLKQTLSSQTSELKYYKDKVQKLQNDLIKKNDQEKQYLRMSHAHASQQKLLQKLQAKAHKIRQMEDTCKKQEKVIEKMELILEKQRRKVGSPKDTNSEANAALTEENRRLRAEMESLRVQMRKEANGNTGGGGGTTAEDLERLELYQVVEKAEGRIMSLEKQMVENSRQWGKEKAGFQMLLSENGRSFGKSGGLILQDYS